METLYFTLGIASVVVAAIAVVAVKAMIMVEKLKEQLGSTHQDITMVERTIMNHLESFIRSCDQRFDNAGRDRDYELSELRRALDERFNQTHLEIEDRSQDTQRKFDEVHRSIDSRVDKLYNKIDSSNNKQLLKG